MTVEALISFFLFISLLVMLVPVHQENLSQLLAMQKMHDLLKVWNLQADEKIEWALAEEVFPNNSVKVEVNGVIMIDTALQVTGDSYSVSGLIYKPNLLGQGSTKKVKITVYF